MRKSTKELALCGVMGALGVVFLCMAGILPFALYACPLLASLVLLAVREECRRSYGWCCYGAIAVLGLLLGPDKEAALLFAFLGYYPLLKPVLDGIGSRVLGYGAKLLLAVVSVGSMYAVAICVLHLASVVEELETQAPWMLWLTAALGLLVFIVYDVLLGRFAVLYRRRRRK